MIFLRKKAWLLLSCMLSSGVGATLFSSSLYADDHSLERSQFETDCSKSHFDKIDANKRDKKHMKTKCLTQLDNIKSTIQSKIAGYSKELEKLIRSIGKLESELGHLESKLNDEEYVTNTMQTKLATELKDVYNDIQALIIQDLEHYESLVTELNQVFPELTKTSIFSSDSESLTSDVDLSDLEAIEQSHAVPLLTRYLSIAKEKVENDPDRYSFLPLMTKDPHKKESDYLADRDTLENIDIQLFETEQPAYIHHYDKELKELNNVAGEINRIVKDDVLAVIEGMKLFLSNLKPTLGEASEKLNDLDQADQADQADKANHVKEISKFISSVSQPFLTGQRLLNGLLADVYTLEQAKMRLNRDIYTENEDIKTLKDKQKEFLKKINNYFKQLKASDKDKGKKGDKKKVEKS